MPKFGSDRIFGADSVLGYWDITPDQNLFFGIYLASWSEHIFSRSELFGPLYLLASQGDASDSIDGGPPVMIPKTIHQIWFQGQENIHESRHLRFQDLWKKHHSGWSYQLWDEPAIAGLMEGDYPEFYDLYSSYPLMIQKIDVAKYFILQRHGGFYLDMDIECRRSLEPLLHHDLVFAQIHMTPFDMFLFTFNKVKEYPFINNAVIGSIPNHPFWKHVNSHLAQYYRRRCYHTKEYYVSASTGPQFFTKMFQSYRFRGDDGVWVAPPECFEPFSLGAEHVEKFRHSFGIHRQDNTWLTWFYRGLKQLRYGDFGI